MRPLLVLALVLLPLASLGEVSPSQLGQSLSAAYFEFMADGSAYADLYRRYLGVAPPRLPEAESAGYVPRREVRPGSDLARVLASGRLRLGYYLAAPYHFEEDGRVVGFDRELAAALVERLRRQYPESGLEVEWVECHPTGLTGGGTDAYTVRDQFQAWLEEGRFDVAFSGLIVEPGEPVDTICHTMILFESAVYTGLGGLDPGPIEDRTALVRAMAAIPDCQVLSTGGGPSEEAVAGLVAEVRAAGGAITSRTGTVSEVQDALARPSVHFVIGDAIALSNLTSAAGFGGVNLNFDVAPQYDEYLGPFCRRD